MEVIIFIYKAVRFIKNQIFDRVYYVGTYSLLKLNRVSFSKFYTKGIPFIFVDKHAEFEIGDNFRMNNIKRANPIGREGKSTFYVSKGASLIIGKNVGLSFTSIVCRINIVIEDSVLIGGNCCIYDTDFHSTDPIIRQSVKDVENTNNQPVRIKRNSFIGAHSTVLKGVTIGENSVVGACSVVAKDVPDNEIWAGNPAKYIKKI